MPYKIRAHVIVKGLVQGVFFRQNLYERAKARDLTGWVKNREDGSVEAVIEGPQSKVKELVEWCKKGPTASRVEDVKITYEAFQDEFSDFEIHY